MRASGAGTLLRALLATLSTVAVAGAEAPAGNGQSVPLGTSPLLDVRAYGARCDGESDDAAAVNRAYQALASTGGGTLVIPAGKTCVVGSEIVVQSSVALRCEPGGTIKAAPEGKFTLGMLSWFDRFVGKSDAGVDGCVFDLNGHAIPAVSVYGARNPVVRSRFLGGPTRHDRTWSLVNYNCAGDQCLLGWNTVSCAATAGAGDVGIAVQGPSKDGEQTMVTGNSVRGCDIAGINVIGGRAHVLSNGVAVTGERAIAINLAVPEAIAADNRIACTGASCTGIAVSGAYALVHGNRIRADGTSATGVALAGEHVAMSSNRIALTGATDAVEAGFGVKVTGVGARIVGNTIRAAVDESNTGVAIGAQHTRIVGNHIAGGRWGVVPSLATVAELAGGINTHVSSNEVFSLSGPDSAAVILLSGWTVTDNYMAWNEQCGVQVGEARGSAKIGSGHAHVTANRFHAERGGKGICFATKPRQTCNAGDRIFQSCTADDTTQCPGAKCGDCCVPARDANIVISDNEFLYPSPGAGPAIDLAMAIDGRSGSISNVVIDGNVAALGADVPFVRFPTFDQSRVSNVTIGSNSISGGRMTENHTADQGTDAGEFVACTTKPRLTASDDGHPIFLSPANVTVTGVACSCRGACGGTLARLTLASGTGSGMAIAGTSPTCATSGAASFAEVTDGNRVVAGAAVAFDVANEPASGDTYLVCVRYRKTGA